MMKGMFEDIPNITIETAMNGDQAVKAIQNNMLTIQHKISLI